MNKREFLLPPEGVAKGCDPFSLRDKVNRRQAREGPLGEKAGMRGYKNQSVSFSDPLTLTLSRGGEGTFATPSGGRESSVVT